MICMTMSAFFLSTSFFDLQAEEVGSPIVVADLSWSLEHSVFPGNATEEGGGGQQPELQEFAHIPSVVQPRLPATTRVQHEAAGNAW